MGGQVSDGFKPSSGPSEKQKRKPAARPVSIPTAVFRVVAAVAFLNDGLPADNVFAVEREGGVAVQLPAVLQGFGNAAAERGVVRSGEVAVEFHERFLQCENIFRRPQKQDGAV